MARSYTVSAKVTKDEYDWLRKEAEKAGMKPGHFYRRMLLGEDGDMLRVLLAECRETRTILFEILIAALRGYEITTDFVRTILKYAEESRFANADRVLMRSVAARAKRDTDTD